MKLPTAATVGLNTQLEEDFISPLTAVRGALEILRDYPDLSSPERMRFVASALKECERLQGGVMRLSEAVYAAAAEAGAVDNDTVALAAPTSSPEAKTASPYAGRIFDITQDGIVEVDFSQFTFKNSQTVNEFYDALETHLNSLGHKAWLIVNYTDCSIWPEAWVAFAHRAKKINVNFVSATVRYSTSETPGGSSDRDMFASREAALEHIRARQKG